MRLKHGLRYLLGSLVLLLAVLILRAMSVFTDQQLAIEQSNPRAQLVMSEAQKQAALQRLSQAIQIATVSYDDPTQINYQPLVQFHQHLRQSFPMIHQQVQPIVINQYSLIYHIKGQDSQRKPLLLLAHMDVVPVATSQLSRWQHPPFSGHIDQQAVWGRGTIDDKGSLMAIMEATELLLSQAKQPPRDIYLAFGHDEETNGQRGAKLIAEYFQQQQIHFDYVLDEGGAITENILPGITQPVALIGIAEKGYVNIHLTVNSEGGHSSQPPDHSAVGILSQAIVNIENQPFDTDLFFTEQSFAAIGHYAPFLNRLIMANLWLFEPLVSRVLVADPSLAASVRTSMATTMISGSPKSNILPSQAAAVVNVRIFPGQTEAQIIDHFNAAINDDRVIVTSELSALPSPVSDIHQPSYQQLAKTIRQIDPQVLVAPYLVRAGTDSKYFYPLADQVYRFVPFRTDPDKLPRFHGLNEQISHQDHWTMIHFYYQLLTVIN